MCLAYCFLKYWHVDHIRWVGDSFRLSQLFLSQRAPRPSTNGSLDTTLSFTSVMLCTAVATSVKLSEVNCKKLMVSAIWWGSINYIPETRLSVMCHSLETKPRVENLHGLQTINSLFFLPVCIWICMGLEKKMKSHQSHLLLTVFHWWGTIHTCSTVSPFHLQMHQ